MKYKGYEAHFDFVQKAKIYVGEVVNCPDIISFGAVDIQSLQINFQKAVDNYINQVVNKPEETAPVAKSLEMFR